MVITPPIARFLALGVTFMFSFYFFVNVGMTLGMLPVKADQELPEEWIDSRLQDRSRQVIITCQTGENAARGAQLLNEMGFTNASYMVGGMEAWKTAGLPTE